MGIKEKIINGGGQTWPRFCCLYLWLDLFKQYVNYKQEAWR